LIGLKVSNKFLLLRVRHALPCLRRFILGVESRRLTA